MPLQESDVKQITSRLDAVIKLMAALFARDLNNSEAVVKLQQMQLSREQIADALGITTANVAQVIYLSKKTEKKADKGSKKGTGEGETAEVPSAMPAEEVQQ